jgi:hypothetical protein
MENFAFGRLLRAEFDFLVFRKIFKYLLDFCVMDNSHLYVAYLSRKASDRPTTRGKTVMIRFFGEREDGRIWDNGGFYARAFESLAGMIAGRAKNRQIQIQHPPFSFSNPEWRDKMCEDDRDYKWTIEQAEKYPERLTDEELAMLQDLLSPRNIDRIKLEIQDYRK